MSKVRIGVLLVVVHLMSACATVYTAEDFGDYQAKHQNVAIMPYDVEIQVKKLPEGLTSDDLKDMEREEAYLFQKQVYSQFLNRYQKGEYTVDFQDVEKTNVLLERAGVSYDNMNSYTKEELAKILEVDALISGDIKRSKPMGTAGALFTTLLIGWGATNNVDVNMRVHGADSGNLIWSYDHTVSGGIGSSPEGLAKSLMKSISKKFPYQKD